MASEKHSAQKRSRRPDRSQRRHHACGTASATLAALLLGALAAAPARAVINSGLTPNTDGSAIAGFNYVGTIGNASGVYLGNGWVLTASHVGTGTLTLNGTAYTPLAGTSIRIVDPLNHLPVDLTLFRLSDPSGLSSMAPLTITTATPVIGAPINIVGFGYWSNTPNYWSYTIDSSGTITWTALGSNPAGAQIVGLNYATTGVRRYGSAYTSSYGGSATQRLSTNNTVVFASTFNSAPGNSTKLGINQAIVTTGDSGGGVFSPEGVLLGISDAKAIFNNQPADSAMVGDASLVIDLATYASRIQSAMTEWTGAVSTLWFDPNWTNAAPPNAPAAAAHFLQSTPAGKINLNANASVGTLNFNHTGPTGYYLTGGGLLTLNNDTQTAAVYAAGSNHLVDARIALAGNVNVTVDSGSLTLGPLSAAAARTIHKMGAGMLVLNGPTALPSGSTISVDTGTLRVLTDLGAVPAASPQQNVTLQVSATAELNTQHLAALTISAGGNATFLSGASGVVSALTIAQSNGVWAGTLTLHDAPLAVLTTAASHDATLATLTSELQSGYNGGTWNGPGITSAAAQANSASAVRQTVGLFDNTQLRQPLTTLAGTSLDANTLIVRPGIEGDLDMDGLLTPNDLLLMATGYLNKRSGYQWGDLNYDHQINAADFAIFDANYQLANGAAAAAPLIAQHSAEFGAAYWQAYTAAVPEPDTLALIAAGALLLRRQKRRLAV